MVEAMLIVAYAIGAPPPSSGGIAGNAIDFYSDKSKHQESTEHIISQQPTKQIKMTSRPAFYRCVDLKLIPVNK